jgi:hypothetical protein
MGSNPKTKQIKKNISQFSSREHDPPFSVKPKFKKIFSKKMVSEFLGLKSKK